MNLLEFQEGLPFNSNFIVLINSDFFPKRIMFSALGEMLVDNGSGGKKQVLGMKVPTSSSVVFFGLADRSFDNLSGLKAFLKKLPEDQFFSIVCGKGDYDLTKDIADALPANVVSLLANNVDLDHDRIHYLPMGRDFRSAHLFEEFPPQREKHILAYCNYSVNTHPVRKQVYAAIKDFDFIEFDHMGKFLSYALSREDFFKKLAGSKFSICPRGNGIDTFRMWDSLYLGTIPIVVKEAKFHDELEDLPILFINHPDDYAKLTAGYLEDVYQEMLHTDYNYEKLKLDYWLNKAYV